jgi:hypothetical protein
MRVHCENCGADYLATGLEARCPCLLLAENKRLREIIEKAKRETRGWATGGYPEHFMKLAVILYHALDEKN